MCLYGNSSDAMTLLYAIDHLGVCKQQWLDLLSNPGWQKMKVLPQQSVTIPVLCLFGTDFYFEVFLCSYCLCVHSRVFFLWCCSLFIVFPEYSSPHSKNCWVVPTQLYGKYGQTQQLDYIFK